MHLCVGGCFDLKFVHCMGLIGSGIGIPSNFDDTIYKHCTNLCIRISPDGSNTMALLNDRYQIIMIMSIEADSSRGIVAELQSCANDSCMRCPMSRGCRLGWNVELLCEIHVFARRTHVPRVTIPGRHPHDGTRPPPTYPSWTDDGQGVCSCMRCGPPPPVCLLHQPHIIISLTATRHPLTTSSPQPQLTTISITAPRRPVTIPRLPSTHHSFEATS